MNRTNWKRGLWRAYVAFAVTWIAGVAVVSVYASLEPARLTARDMRSTYAELNADLETQVSNSLHSIPAGLTSGPPLIEIRWADKSDEAVERDANVNVHAPPGSVPESTMRSDGTYIHFVSPNTVRVTPSGSAHDSDGNPVRKVGHDRRTGDDYLFPGGVTDEEIRRWFGPMLRTRRLKNEEANRKLVAEFEEKASMLRQFFPKLRSLLSGEHAVAMNILLFGPPITILFVGLTVAWIVKGFSATNSVP